LIASFTTVEGRQRLIRCALAALLFLAISGCDRDQPEVPKDPVAAARLFVQASYVGAGDTLFRMLTPEAQATLADRAKKTNEAAGTTVVKPADLLVAQGFVPRRVKSVERVDDGSSANRARVRVTGHFAAPHDLSLIRVDNTWRVEIKLGPAGEDGT
jgi:hypothetical protein